MNFKKFDKTQRSTFSYWWNHMLAFNYVAWKLGHWKPRYIFHDFEKPWLRLWYLGDYSKVQKKHRENNKHHLEYKYPEKRNFEDMAIDWQCSRYTKLAHQKDVFGEAQNKLDKKEISYSDYQKVITSALKLGMQREICE